MRSVNKIILMGAVGRDPEMHTTQNGVKIANLSLATSRRGKDKEEVTQWHNCVAFAKTADIIEQYVTKGSKVYLEGEVQYQTYEKDGEKRYATKIIINEIILLGGGDNAAYEGHPKQTAKSSTKASSKSVAYENIDDQDIPF